MKNRIEVKGTKGKVSDVESHLVKNLLQQSPEIGDCLKRKDISTLIKIMSKKAHGLNGNFNKIIAEVDPVFASNYFTTRLIQHQEVNLSSLVIDYLCIDSNINPLYLLMCEINELVIDLTYYEDADIEYLRLSHSLLVQECNINTIKIRLNPKSYSAQLKYKLKMDLTHNYTDVQTIIIE